MKINLFVSKSTLELVQNKSVLSKKSVDYTNKYVDKKSKHVTKAL